MSSETKVTTKRIKRSFQERMNDYGRMKLASIVANTIPSQDILNALDEARKELESLKSVIDSIPLNMRETILKNAEFKVSALSEKVGNPSNLSETDHFILKNAARLIIRSGKYNILSLAQFVSENKEMFPIKGTKF